MGKLVTFIGSSGVGKTSLVRALSLKANFAVALEGHTERPFQALFDRDKRHGLANQVDYLLLRAEQERELRASPYIGLMDGGLDLDFHGFTRLFHTRGLLSDPEFDLCRRLYKVLRTQLPTPELVVQLKAPVEVIRSRLGTRSRLNIAGPEDTTLFETYIEEWLESLPPERVLVLDITNETIEYTDSLAKILERIATIDNNEHAR